jgi:hypothetical protein
MYQSHTGDMGLVNLVIGRRQELGLCPPCFISWIEREVGYGPADRLADVLLIMSGALFLRSGGICPNLSLSRKRLPRTGTICRKRTLGVRGLIWDAYVSCWSGFPL